MGTRAIHTVFTVGGENEYRAALKRINSVIKEINSEMELTKERFAGQEDSYTALYKKQGELQRMYEAQKELAKTYAERLKQVQDSTDSLNAYSEELLDTLNQIQAAMHNTSETSVGYDELARESGEVERELQAVAIQMEKNATKALELETGINKAHTEMEKLERELQDVAPLVEEAESDTEGLARSMNDVGDGADKMREKTVSAMDAIVSTAAAAQIDEVFRKVLEVMKACAEEAIEFETAVTGVFKTIDATAAEELAITEGIKDLATRLPATTTEIAGVAETAGQLGIATEDILAFTEVMVQMGTSTNLSAEEAATNLAKLANILGLSADDYEKMGSSIVDLGNHFATTEAEITEMATRMAGSGDMIGLTADELFGIAAALASVGIESDAGGSAMQKLFARIQLSMADLREAKSQLEQMGISVEDLNRAAQEGGFEELADSAAVSVEELEAMGQALSETNKYAEVAGMAAVDFAKLWEEDAAGGLNAFIEGLAGVEESGGDALAVLDDMGLTEVRLSRAIMSLASAEGLLSDALNLSEDAWERNSALAEEAARRYETTDSKITIMNNSIGLLKQAVGEDFLTTLEPAVEWATDFAIGAADAAESTPDLSAALGGLGGALGGLTGLATVAGGIKLISTALTIFGTAAGPVAAGVGILSGLAGAVAVYHANATELSQEAETLIAANDNLIEKVERSKAAFESAGFVSGEKRQQVELLTEKLEALTSAVSNTEAEKIVIKGYVDQLNELLPGLGATFDEVTGKVNLSRDAILKFAEASAETAKLEATRTYIQNLTEEQVNLEVQMMLTTEQIEEANAKLEEAEGKVEAYTEGLTPLQRALEYTNPYFIDLKNAEAQARNELEELTESQGELQTKLQDVEKELETAQGVYDEYQDKLRETADVSKQTGKDAASGFAEGVEAESGKIAAAGESIGKSFAEGVRLGIASQQNNVLESARTIAETADLATREVLRIESPSKVARETYGYYGEGAVLGLRDKLQAIKQAAAELTDPLVDTGAITESISRGRNILRNAVRVTDDQYGESYMSGPRSGDTGGQEERSVVNNYNITIDAKNVKEFNDIVRIAENERQETRMGYVGG